MDGGSSLNIIYLETLDLLGIETTQLQPSAGNFHGVVLGKKALPVGQIDLLLCFGTAANFRNEVLTFEVVGFRGRTTPSSGARDTQSSWLSQTTLT